jgi:mitochondrial fission protein ELM1
MAKKALILSDGKLGHQNQAVRIAEKLGLDYEILTIERRKFGRFFALINPKLITKDSKEAFKKAQTADIAIGLGTVPRLMLVALKRKNSQLKTICVMNPKQHFDSYDVIAVPNHDNISYNGANLVRFCGSLSFFDKSTLNQAKKDFEQEFKPLINKTLIGLIIGGKSNGYDFPLLKAREIIDKTSILANKLNANVYASNSRRTGIEQSNYIKYKLKKLGYSGYFVGSNKSNPFRAILGYSDVIIITPETISMLSEACNSGSLVLIYDRFGVKSKRIQSYIDELIKNKQAYDYETVVNSDKIQELTRKAKANTNSKELDKVTEFIKTKLSI